MKMCIFVPLIRLFPPRTCCVSSSRRNPNWTTWWVLDVSKISNSAWIERIRVSRNQTHINFYQHWKYWVWFIASQIYIKGGTMHLCISFLLQKGRARILSYVKNHQIYKDDIQSPCWIEEDGRPTHSHTPHNHTLLTTYHNHNHTPHATYHNHTPHHIIHYLNWRTPTSRCAPLTAWGSHQSNNKYRQKVFTILEKNTLWKKRLKIQRKLSHTNTPLAFFSEYFLLFMMLMLSFFCVGNQCQ